MSLFSCMSFRNPFLQRTKRKVSWKKAMVVHNASSILHPALGLGSLTRINCINRISIPSGFYLRWTNGEPPRNQTEEIKLHRNIYSLASLQLGCLEWPACPPKHTEQLKLTQDNFLSLMISTNSNNCSLLHPLVPMAVKNWADISP